MIIYSTRCTNIKFIMKTVLSLLAAASAIFESITNASAIPAKDISVKRQSCENTATSRDCWGDYDLTTNW
jgi:hypothetical protein